MSVERKGSRISKKELENLDFQTRILVPESEIEGVFGIALTTVHLGKTLEMHEVGDYLETWQILKGVGLLSFIEAGNANKKNVRFEEGMVFQATFGDKLGVINIGREKLIMLITKTHG